jgi:hypothetical protein
MQHAQEKRSEGIGIRCLLPQNKSKILGLSLIDSSTKPVTGRRWHPASVPSSSRLPPARRGRKVEGRRVCSSDDGGHGHRAAAAVPSLERQKREIISPLSPDFSFLSPILLKICAFLF